MRKYCLGYLTLSFWRAALIAALLVNCGPITPSIEKSGKKSGSSRQALNEDPDLAISPEQTPDYVVGVRIRPVRSDSIPPAETTPADAEDNTLSISPEAVLSFKENYFCFLTLKSDELQNTVKPQITFMFSDHDDWVALNQTSPFQVSITKMGPDLWLLRLEQQELISRGEYDILKYSLQKIIVRY